MQTALSSTKKQYAPINRKKRNDDRPKQYDVYKLASSIPKSCPLYNTDATFLQLWELALNLTQYIRNNYPNEIKNTTFKPYQDSISTYIATLIQFFENKKELLATDYQTSNDTYFLFEIPFNPQFYVLEAKWFHKLPCKELKIGFAHLFFKFINLFQNNVFENPYMLEQTIECLEAEEENSPEHLENLKKSKASLAATNKIEKLLNKYQSKNIELFKNYNPRKNNNKKLKKLINKGLQINFNCLFNFADSESDEFGLLRYDAFFMIANDFDDQLENFHFSQEIEIANNNGISMPMGYTRYKNGMQSYKTSKEEIQNFTYACKYLEQLINTFSNTL